MMTNQLSIVDSHEIDFINLVSWHNDQELTTNSYETCNSHKWFILFTYNQQSQNSAGPGYARPKIICFSLFWHEWAWERRYEALDWCILNDFSSSLDVEGPQDRFVGLAGGL